jgi:hypothetical protein
MKFKQITKHKLMSQIMKKAILTIGLFSMMMVLTSFTSGEIGGNNQSKPQEPNPLGLVKLEIGGNNQSKPQEPNPLGYNEIGGNNQSKPQEPNPLG